MNIKSILSFKVSEKVIKISTALGICKSIIQKEVNKNYSGVSSNPIRKSTFINSFGRS